MKNAPKQNTSAREKMIWAWDAFLHIKQSHLLSPKSCTYISRTYSGSTSSLFLAFPKNLSGWFAGQIMRNRSVITAAFLRGNLTRLPVHYAHNPQNNIRFFNRGKVISAPLYV